MKKTEGTNSNHSKGEQTQKRGINPNYKRFLYLANIILLCVITLIALGFAFHFLIQKQEVDEENVQLEALVDQLEGEDKVLYTQEEVEEEIALAKEEGAQEERGQILMQIQRDMESGASTATMLRSLFSEDIVVVSGGKYYFYPVLDSIALNSYDADDFTLTEDGRLSYSGDEMLRIETGMDISSDDGEIDWAAASEDDITFVMVDAGSRLVADSEEGDAGEIMDDASFLENVAGAVEVGLSCGVMWTLGATSEGEATEEAEHLILLLDEVKSSISYPVAVCVNVPQETDRTVELDRAQWTQNLEVFCSALEEAGYTPMIYGTLASFVMMLDLEELEEYGYQRFISNIGSSLYFPYEFTMWQYSTTGAVQGITTEVHLDARIVEDIGGAGEIAPSPDGEEEMISEISESE